jgi:acyl homoserine lactone synthase
MRAISISKADYGRNFKLITDMHRLRCRVFKDRLDWNVLVTGDMEIDTFDALGPDCLLIVSDRGDVLGCVRLLPTTGPTMLSDTFPALLAGEAMPRSPRLAESSRFCVDTRLAVDTDQSGLRRATFLLFAAMIEWGLENSPEGIVTVTDLRMERVLRRAGWPLTRIGAPVEIGRTTAVAGFLEVSRTALERVASAGGLALPVLEAEPAASIAA